MARISSAICFALVVASSTIYVAYGSFSFPDYFKNTPKSYQEVEPFTYQGMTTFLTTLEGGSPHTPEFTNFFTKLKDYMNSIHKVSSSNDAKTVLLELRGKANEVKKCMAAMGNGEGKLVEMLQIMAWTMMDYKKGGSMKMTGDDQGEVQEMMGSCGEEIAKFVTAAASKKGSKVDIAPFGFGKYRVASGSGDEESDGSHSTEDVKDEA